MTCIHEPNNSVVDYVISKILVYYQIVNFDILSDHETDLNHKTLLLTLKFVMHNDLVE
jgi:hypothetical protein